MELVFKPFVCETQGCFICFNLANQGHNDETMVKILQQYLTIKSIKCIMLTELKIAEFANSVDLDEVAHNEPPLLDLQYLPSNL